VRRALMADNQVYPRRKRATRGHAADAHDRHGSRAPDTATREAVDVAGYVHDMTAQLEAMALAAGLDLLAYFLGMARSEADLFVRTNDVAEEAAESQGAALSDEDQAGFGGSDD